METNIFNKYTLKTKKKLNFDLFYSAVKIKINNIHITNNEKLEILKIKNKMNKNNNSIYNPSNCNININWLIGFTEGDGTFGIKNFHPYYQLAQLEDSIKLLENIKSFINKLYIKNIGINKNIVTIVKNKKTNVLSLTIQDIDALFFIILPIFRKNSMYSKKAIDFKLWYMVVKCFKLGYIVLPQGRSFIIWISKLINKNKYTLITDKNTIDVYYKNIFYLYKNLLKITPPYNIKEGKSHTQLAQEYSKKKWIKLFMFIKIMYY